MLKIREYELDVDIFDEISNYEWQEGRRKGEEFVCCSPFRDESHPSFSINLETGLWIDFGSSDDYWKKGHFVKLISFLENITVEEAEEMLLQAYGVRFDESDDLELIINIQEEAAEEKTFTREELGPYLLRKKGYLLKRGISEEVQKRFVIGYDEKRAAVAFFWRDWKTGKVVNVKFRNTASKVFYYMDGGQQIKNHLYGLYDVIKGGHKEVFIVESEVDCLYLWTHGFPAIALGGSNLSDRQKILLLLSGIETLVLATDNDRAGYRIRKQIEREVGGQIDLKVMYLPPYAKDVNDLTPKELISYAENAEAEELFPIKKALNH